MRTPLLLSFIAVCLAQQPRTTSRPLYDYVRNTATPPPNQPYTGTPFAYRTSMNPTGMNSGGPMGNNRQQQMHAYQTTTMSPYRTSSSYSSANQQYNPSYSNSYNQQYQSSTYSPYNSNYNQQSMYSNQQSMYSNQQTPYNTGYGGQNGQMMYNQPYGDQPQYGNQQSGPYSPYNNNQNMQYQYQGTNGNMQYQNSNAYPNNVNYMNQRNQTMYSPYSSSGSATGYNNQMMYNPSTNTYSTQSSQYMPNGYNTNWNTNYNSNQNRVGGYRFFLRQRRQAPTEA